jgi:hypothetical protein
MNLSGMKPGAFDFFKFPIISIGFCWQLAAVGNILVGIDEV